LGRGPRRCGCHDPWSCRSPLFVPDHRHVLDGARGAPSHETLAVRSTIVRRGACPAEMRHHRTSSSRSPRQAIRAGRWGVAQDGKGRSLVCARWPTDRVGLSSHSPSRASFGSGIESSDRPQIPPLTFAGRTSDQSLVASLPGLWRRQHRWSPPNRYVGPLTVAKEPMQALVGRAGDNTLARCRSVASGRKQQESGDPVPGNDQASPDRNRSRTAGVNSCGRARRVRPMSPWTSPALRRRRPRARWRVGYSASSGVPCRGPGGFPQPKPGLRIRTGVVRLPHDGGERLGRHGSHQR